MSVDCYLLETDKLLNKNQVHKKHTSIS